MPMLEIKGLAQHVQNAKKGISDLRGVAADLHSSTSALVQEMNDVKEQVEQARADLRFEAETLGNSAPSSNSSNEPSNLRDTPAVGINPIPQ